MNKQINITITCPDCGKQIHVKTERDSVTIDLDLEHLLITGKSGDRPDGGTRGESQESYFGG